MLRKLQVPFFNVSRNVYLQNRNSFNQNNMTKFRDFMSLFFLLILLNSCGGPGGSSSEDLNPKDFKTEAYEDLYEIAVPKYMKKASGLNQDASMQFENILKETYLAIIDEDKSDFVDAFSEYDALNPEMSTIANYRNIQVDYFMESLQVIKNGTPKAMNINGMPAEQVEFTGRVKDVPYDIFYLMTFVEGDEDLYMIMTWTLSDSEDKYKPTLYTMAESFKEL